MHQMTASWTNQAATKLTEPILENLGQLQDYGAYVWYEVRSTYFVGTREWARRVRLYVGQWGKINMCH